MSSDDGWGMKFGEMEGASAGLQKAAGEIQQAIDTMKERIEAEVRWDETSSSRTAYQVSKDRIDAAMLELNDTVRRSGKSVAAIGEGGLGMEKHMGNNLFA